MFENNLWTMEPVGRPENTIQGDKYRFTLLTPLPDPNGIQGRRQIRRPSYPGCMEP